MALRYPQQRPFNLAYGETKDIQVTGMQAQYIAVDNPGSYWVHFPQVAGALAWVPPTTFGAIVPAPGTVTSTIRVTTVDLPALYTLNTTNLIAGVSGTVYEEFPQVSLGVQQVVATSGTVTIPGNPWAPVGGKTTTGAGADSFTTTAVGSGIQQLMILIPGAGILTGLQVKGHTTNAIYLFPPASGSTGAVTVPVNGAADSTYDISWTSSSGAGIIVAAYESALQPGYPNLGQEPQNLSIPVVIALDQAAGRSGQQTSANSLPVVPASDFVQAVVTGNTGDSKMAAGTALNPGAGTAVATIAAPGAGVYEVQIVTFCITAAGTTNNMELRHGATTVTASALSNVLNLPVQVTVNRLTVGAGEAVSVNATAADAGGGSRYVAAIIATRVI